MDCRHRHGFRTFFSHLIGTQQAVKLKTSEEKQDGRLQEHDCDRGASGSQGRQRHDRRKHSAGSGHHRDALRRYLDPNDNYAPSLHIIPGLCRVMRNRILLQWLEAQIVADDTPVTPAATRADVLTAVARAGSALGEVQRIVAEAQVLYPSTAREIRSGLGDVIAACRSAQAGLQPLAERRDRDVALASLSDGEQAPPVAMPEKKEMKRWWHFWKRSGRAASSG